VKYIFNGLAIYDLESIKTATSSEANGEAGDKISNPIYASNSHAQNKDL